MARVLHHHSLSNSELLFGAASVESAGAVFHPTQIQKRAANRRAGSLRNG
jgi:hypothetical protein